MCNRPARRWMFVSQKSYCDVARGSTSVLLRMSGSSVEDERPGRGDGALPVGVNPPLRSQLIVSACLSRRLPTAVN